jgi:hypothetical protein
MLIFIFLFHLIPFNYLLYAQSPSSKFQLTVKNNVLTISAKNADLKNVLLSLAGEADISIGYPDSLDKKVTLYKRRIPLKQALVRLLKGLSYAIIYSGSKQNKAIISDVLIFKESKKTNRLGANERRIANRIRSYERQLEYLRNRLSKVEANSRRGKNYIRRIDLIEKNIEKLRGQL